MIAGLAAVSLAALVASICSPLRWTDASRTEPTMVIPRGGALEFSRLRMTVSNNQPGSARD